MAETQFKYDVFLSYNSKDKTAVENIARLLRNEHSLKVWLDTWNLIPGEVVQKELEDALDACQTVAVFVGESGIGPWENEEMRSAIEERVKDPKRRVIPVLLPGAPNKDNLKLPRFLRLALWVDFRSGLDDKDALYRLYCGVTGQAPGDRGSSTTHSGTPDTQWFLKHRYGLPADFTGRVAERKLLTQWLAGNGEQPLLVLRALGGFGKSALAWYWLLHDVAREKWTRVVWWGFYDDNNFETFLKETLEYLKADVPPSPRLQADALLRELERQNVLLVMDGFERALRAFAGLGAAYQLDGGADEGRDLDCVSTVAEEFLRGFASSGGLMRGRVLMTTRLTPRALYVGAGHAAPLHGMFERELTQMEAADAAQFFARQGIHGARAEIERTCAAYGFHPLSLRLLAGLIVTDKRQPLEIAAAERYAQKVSADAVQRQHHVLEQSYAGLAPASKALLGRLACFRSSVTYDTLAEITKDDPLAARLDETLDDLTTRGLVHSATIRLATGGLATTFDLHPIVRRYAYDRLTAPERTGVHAVLIVYFDAVPKPQKVEKLEDLAPVIELYHHTVRAGKLDEAIVLFRDRLNKATYYQFGAYQLRIELLRALFLDGEDKPPRLKDESAQAWTLNGLANTYSASGQPRRAVPLAEMQIAIREKQGDKKNFATGLGNVATQQLVIGVLSAAERNLRRSIDLCREIEDEFREAVGHQELGRVLSYRGVWGEAEQKLDSAIAIQQKIKHVQIEGISHAYRALRFLLMARSNPQSSIVNCKSAIESAHRALELADEWQKITGRANPNPNDYTRGLWLLGAAYCANNELTLAEENLSKALDLCRQVNLVENEANILLDIARLRYAQGDFKDALEKAQEALVITERSGYVLQGADVHLFMAELAMAGQKSKVEGQLSDKEAARFHAESALKLAYCDGGEYKYKVAYEEAERMLEKLK